MEPKKCPHCGAENDQYSAFCCACGQSMNAPAAQAAPASQSAWGAAPASNQSPAPSGWGGSPVGSPAERSITGFHRGYANTLKVVTYIFAFGLPLITFFALCFSFDRYDAELGIPLSFLGCALWAFFLWLFGSFAAKLFDLVSKIAMFNDQLLRELRELRKENDK